MSVTQIYILKKLTTLIKDYDRCNPITQEKSLNAWLRQILSLQKMDAKKEQGLKKVFSQEKEIETEKELILSALKNYAGLKKKNSSPSSLDFRFFNLIHILNLLVIVRRILFQIKYYFNPLDKRKILSQIYLEVK